MFRTTIKIISTVLAAAAIAVPVASAGSNPTTPSIGQGFSLGVPLQYLNTGAPTHVTEGFSLGVPVQYQASTAPSHVTQGFSLGVPMQYQASTAPNHVAQGFSLGVPTEYLAQPTATASGSGFDWSSAGIGAAIVAGAFLLIAGIGAMTIRARQGQRAGGLSAT
jgi:hypothetical protein